jgi:hypothetical protein
MRFVNEKQNISIDLFVCKLKVTSEPAHYIPDDLHAILLNEWNGLIAMTTEIGQLSLLLHGRQRKQWRADIVACSQLATPNISASN